MTWGKTEVQKKKSLYIKELFVFYPSVKYFLDAFYLHFG